MALASSARSSSISSLAWRSCCLKARSLAESFALTEPLSPCRVRLRVAAKVRGCARKVRVRVRGAVKGFFLG